MKHHESILGLTRNFALIMLLATFSLAWDACKPPPGPRKQPNGTYITGSVKVYDDKGNELSDLANVQVQVTGGSTTKTYSTNSQGVFTTEEFPWGECKFTMTRADLGKLWGSTTLTYDNTNPYVPKDIGVIKISQFSSFTVTKITKTADSYSGEGTPAYDITFSPAADYGHPAYYRVFVDTTAAVSKDHYVAFTKVRNAIAQPAMSGLTLADLQFGTLPVGPTYYLTIYGDASQYNNIGLDEKGQTVFPCLSKTHPDPISFTR